MNLKRSEILNHLPKNGKFFTVEFIKRTNNELRTMNCRLGVKKHLKGGVKKFDDKAYNLITVFEPKSKGYRSIPIENIISISTDNGKYTIVD